MLRRSSTWVLALYVLAGIAGLQHGLEFCRHSADPSGLAGVRAESHDRESHHNPLCLAHDECHTCSLLATPALTAAQAPVAGHIFVEATVSRPEVLAAADRPSPFAGRAPPAFAAPV